MTRQKFIDLVKADRKAQLRQVGVLMALILVFAVLGVNLVKQAEEKLLRLDSPQLWILISFAVVVAVLAVLGLRLTGKALLRCPHCQRCLGGLPAQVVVGSGRCGFCGEQVIEQD